MYQNINAVGGDCTHKDRTTHAKEEAGVSESAGHRKYSSAQTAL